MEYFLFLESSQNFKLETPFEMSVQRVTSHPLSAKQTQIENQKINLFCVLVLLRINSIFYESIGLIDIDGLYYLFILTFNIKNKIMESLQD